ncbi:M13 family metallopeptidase [Novosphingobium sp. G106]|uniref:M13 family metallopeptidase n=1 Tax=Novosphingobium sp. G106 TaxID=2849500 RepID=UPI001C2D70FF|nr:M13 family metallopeptidase [Novosphingobium sp. G106]MBV1690922.1 M13 family metallopeptidase [Novosphingobium sp. G106]
MRRILAAAAVSILALSTPLLAQPLQPQTPLPMPQATAPAPAAGEWGNFGIQTQWIDTAAKPGDDFNRYVNGKWLDVTQIPADKTRIGSFITLRDLSEDRLHAILNELVASNPAPGSSQARVADAYKAFMNTDAINAAGLYPAKATLDRIAAAATVDDLLVLFAAPGLQAPIGIGVDADEKQSDRYALYLGQGGLGLPDRDYYLQDTPKFRDIRAKYLDYLTFMLGKAGYADPRTSAQAVFDLETVMARESWDRGLGRNRDLTYNKLTLAELEALAPAGMMRKFLTDVGAGAATEVIVPQMPPTAEELAAAKYTPEMAAKLGGGVPASIKLITTTPIATWKAYLAAHFISDMASVLPKEIDDAQFAFFGTLLGGQQVQRVRWRRGIGAVEGEVGELLGQIYAQRFFPPANQAAMNDLVANLRKAMAANLAQLPWMGPETRQQAEAKLAAFTPKIGAPVTYKTYDGLAIDATKPLDNKLAAAKWDTDFRLARIGKPVDKTEWFMLPQTVNAYYNPTFNEIVFPAAILQPPFFNLAADPAVNYGAIGAVIGHEMGHGFDDQGAKSDGAGNLRDWWTPQDKAAFEALTSKLVGQYNEFCPFDAGKTCVNGQLTLGENIGDLGGLSLAYRAYKLSLNGKESPVIDGYTGDQRFFLAFAQIWRGLVREPLARQFLVTDPHSPPEYRVNGIVRNFDEWYRAFNVQPTDKLYLPPEKRVRIW